MDRVQRRNELDKDWAVAYLVRGTFGIDESDRGEGDTRWVEAAELEANVDAADIKGELNTFAKVVAKDVNKVSGLLTLNVKQRSR
jgi:hypothetical protein